MQERGRVEEETRRTKKEAGGSRGKKDVVMGWGVFVKHEQAGSSHEQLLEAGLH